MEKSIAFSGNYDGNNDAYVIPVSGGVPVRLTDHGYSDRVVDWTTDGKKVLFASGRESEKSRFNQFYTVPAKADPAEKLPLAYAEFGSYSPDGKTDRCCISYAGRTQLETLSRWMESGYQYFQFSIKESKVIGKEADAGNEFPMWHGNTIYFLI